MTAKRRSPGQPARPGATAPAATSRAATPSGATPAAATSRAVTPSGATGPAGSALLARLARTNRVVVFLGVALLLLVGLSVPGLVGGLVLAVLAAPLVVLARLTWRVTPSRVRAARLLLLTLLIVTAVAKVIW